MGYRIDALARHICIQCSARTTPIAIRPGAIEGPGSTCRCQVMLPSARRPTEVPPSEACVEVHAVRRLPVNC